jgi:hypothetical protein
MSLADASNKGREPVIRTSHPAAIVSAEKSKRATPFSILPLLIISPLSVFIDGMASVSIRITPE